MVDRPGPPGQQGEDGEPGKSAYQIARARGFRGTDKEWLDSLKGVGERGPKGEPGRDGNDGRDGVDGRDGKDATAPAPKPWMATFTRDPMTKLTQFVRVEPKDKIGTAWGLEPSSFDDDGLMVEVDIYPIPT